MTIGERIKELRIHQKMSQQALADDLHISRQSVSKWEQNLTWPTFANVVAISDIFDVSLDSLIRGDKEFMNNLEQNPHARILEIIGLGGVIAIIFLTIIAFGGIKEAHIDVWIQLLQVIAFIFLALNVNWTKINNSLTKKGLIWGIIWFAALAVPAITDFVAGFINGLSR